MKFLWVLFPLLTALTVLGAQRYTDPLGQLERLTLSLPSYSSAVETSLDDQFYWSAQRVEAIVVEQLGAEVVYGVPPITGAAGVTNFVARVITVDQTQHWTARFETLTHEAGHLLSPTFSSRPEGDVFAEAVSYLVAIHDGDQGALRRSAHYLSGMKMALHILREYRAEILRAAQFLQ